MSPTVPPSRRSAGFTLIELLVVISIIALLVAMLLPALGSARAAAQSTGCLSNMRQFTIGASNYVETNAQYWPAGVNYPFASTPSLWGGITWAQAISWELGLEYTAESTYGSGHYPGYKQSYALKPRNNGIFQCPTDNYTNLWNGANATTYMWNISVYGMGEGDAWAHGAYAANPIWYRYYGRRKTPDILYPVESVMVGEYADFNKSVYDYGTANFVTPDNLTTHHLNGGNVLWVDGHATATTKTTLTAADLNIFD